MPRTSVRLTWLAVVVGAVLPACNCAPPVTPDGGMDAGEPDAGEPDAGEPDGGLPDGGFTETGYCNALAQARCDRELDCEYLDLEQYPTCLQRLAADCRADFFRVDAGMAAFDLAAAPACVASVRGLRCPEGPLTSPSACAFHTVFTPAAPNGNPCVDSLDCTSGFCFGLSTECRTCRAFTATSQPCSTTDKRCDPASHFCPSAGAPRTCTALLSDGAPCGASSECASAWCNWSSHVPDAGPDRCGRQPLGAPCGDPDDCVPGAFCQGYWFDGTSITPGTCVTRIAAGQPCANHLDDDGCAPPTLCLGGTCRAVAPYSLDAGAECESLSQCAEDSFCKGLEALQPDGGRSLREGTCTPRLGVNAGCDYGTYVDTDCAAGTTCGAADTCVPRGSADAGCAARYECRDFLHCPATTGRCAPFAATGQPCDVGRSVCASGWCGALAPDAGATCNDPLLEGASCDPMAQGACASSRCFAADAGPSPACQAACYP